MPLTATLLSILQHDLLSAWRRKSDWVNAWLFFVLVVSLFPLAITPDDALLHTIAPGLIWVSALLSMLLALNHFLKPDYQDGSLSLLLLSPHSLSLLLLAKITAHWLMSGLPLILMTPLLALFLHLSADETITLMWALLWGTPILSLVGGVVVSLTISLENQSFLLALLVLPLCVPVLVFGAGAVVNASLGLPTHGVLTLLAAFLILAITLAPLAASAALRLGEF
jgi:heme exporter protein B